MAVLLTISFLIYFKDLNSGSLRPVGGDDMQRIDILLGCLFVWQLAHNIHLILEMDS